MTNTVHVPGNIGYSVDELILHMVFGAFLKSYTFSVNRINHNILMCTYYAKFSDSGLW